MNTILILSRRDDRTDYDQKNTIKDGIDSIDTNCLYEYGEYEQLVFQYDGTDVHVFLNDNDISVYDGVFLTGWFKTKVLEDIALSVAKYMEFHGKLVRNSEILFTRSRSKLSQYMMAALNDISLTPFLFCLDKEVYHTSFARYWNSGYPVIMKGVLANRGNDNYLIQDSEGIDNTLKTSSEEGPFFVTQSFVPNDGDYRVIIMGNEVKYIIHRKSQDDSHLNNTSKGGVASELEVSDFPDDIQKQCVKLAGLLHREIAGVDMIKDKHTGTYYLLEINNMPQMATGSFINEKLRTLDAYLSTELN